MASLVPATTLRDDSVVSGVMMNASQIVSGPVQAFLTGLPVGTPRPTPPEVRPIEISFFRAWVGPGGLLFGAPVIVIAVWMAAVHFGGSLWALAEAGPSAWWAHLPAPTWQAAALVLGWTAVQGLLLGWLPGPTVTGPVTPEGDQPTYRKNGVLSWAVTHVALLGAWWGGWLDANAFYEGFGSLLVTLNLGALLFCAFLYWKGRTYPTGRDSVVTGLAFYDVFQGVELHPRLGNVNLKQLINCRVSMMGWSAICLIFALAQLERHGAMSTGMIASTVVLVVYLFKFFVWEDGYFQSIDIIHDRFGFYICWGVLVWVPAIYCLHALYQVDRPMDWPVAVAAGFVALGIAAIWVNYEADAQRQRVRATDGATTVWGKPPEILRARWTAGDGKERESVLLLSGWWGVARHFHYVPELTLAFAWTVPAGFGHFLPWFYWVFLLILLTDRARRDERKCAAKYGASWEAYQARVRWRMLPGIY